MTSWLINMICQSLLYCDHIPSLCLWPLSCLDLPSWEVDAEGCDMPSALDSRRTQHQTLAILL